MRSNKIVKTLANQIYEEVLSGVTEYAEVQKGTVATLAVCDVDSALGKISGIVHALDSIIKSVAVDGVSLPDFHCSVKTYESDVLKSVEVAVRGKKGVNASCKSETHIDVTENFIMDLFGAIMGTVYAIFYTRFALENIQELNALIATVVAESNVSYSFEFTVNGTEHVVESISDEKLVINLSTEAALSIPELGVFAGGDSYDDLIQEKSMKELETSIKTCETTTRLLCGDVKLIRDLTGIKGDFTKVNSRKRVRTLIRKVYKRKVENLSAVKEGIGYVSNTVPMDGESVKVFALVEKTSDGQLRTVLSPFNTETLFKVDVDAVGLAETAASKG